MASFFNLILDTLPPSNLVVSVNDGARYTSRVNATLSVSVDDGDTSGYQMKIWGVDGTESEGDASWETFTDSKAITLTSGDGQKEISVKVRDNVGNETAEQTATINLVSDVPVVTVTGPDKSTISKITDFDSAAISFTADVDFVEYKVCVVPEENSLVEAGKLIPTTAGSVNTSGTGEYNAETPINVTIKGADLEEASGGDGTKIVKVFVKDSRDIWSVA